MTDMHIGINLEFVRHADKSFEYGGQRARPRWATATSSPAS